MNQLVNDQHNCLLLNVSLNHRIFGFLLLFNLYAYSQQAENAPYFKEYQNPYSIFHWTTSNGLPQSHVSGITQTKNKLLWLSTYNGIVSFDGRRFTSINEIIKKRKLSLFITSVKGIGDSLVWASTKEAVIFYNKKIISVYKFKDNNVFVPSIKKCGNGIYFFSHRAVYKLKDDKLIRTLDLAKSPALKGHTIMTCVFHKNTFIYLMSDGKQSYIVQQDPKKQELKITKPKAKIINISELHSRLLYQIGNKWYWADGKLNPGKLYKSYKNTSNDLQQSAIEKNADFFYTGKTLEINSNGTNSTLNVEPYLQSNELFSSYVDHTDNLWLATNSNGIYMFRRYPFEYPAKENNLRITNSSHSFVDHNKIVWFDDEYHVTYGINLVKHKLDHQIENVCNWANATWSADSIAMFAFGKGHTWYNTKTRKSTPLSGVPFPVNYCTRYNKSAFLLGSPGKLYLWNGKNVKSFKRFKNSETTCNHIIQLEKSWYFATSEGVYRFDNGKWALITPKKNGMVSDCRSLLSIENYSSLLIGTSGNGIFKYDLKTGKCSSLPKLPTIMNDCWSMVEDKYGQLWISSNNGIVEVKLNELIKSFRLKRAAFLVNHYQFETGIQNVEFNSRTPNKGYLLDNGDIIFSSLIGPLVIKPRNNEQFNNVIADILIENITINGKQCNALKTDLSVKEGEQVQLTFTLPTFSIERSLHFEYRIKGYRNEWTSLNGRQIILDNLPNGSYELQIQLSSGKRSRTIHLEIVSRNPNAWIWQLLLLIFIIVKVIFFTVWITRYFQQKKNSADNLRQHVKALEIDSLQAQMNPHFVFNCLNTIQFLFLSGNNTKANKYLSDFSSLLRISLELMRESVSTLDKELKATQLYVHLEQLQFDDGFELRIIDHLKTPHNQVKTPTMFLQLFIENAIIHGLKNTDEEKPILTLTMRETEKEYIFTVGDNGPGFSSAPKIGHKSVGLTLLRERFKLKSELYRWNIDFDISQNETLIDNVKTVVTIKIGKHRNEPV